MQLGGAVAVVTGGASGIGLGIARAVAARGAKVILADIETDRAAQAAEALRGEGFLARSAPLDVIDERSWETLADIAYLRTSEPVTLLFNNAGVGVGGTVHETPRRLWDWVMAVNLTGVYLGVKTFAPRMLASGVACRIVNTASEHALGLPPSDRGGIAAPYTASKHAVLGYTLAMRRDFEGSNLSAGVICPGLVSSDIWNALRNRHPEFGGARQAPESYAETSRSGLSAQVAGERIADQIEDDAFFLFTNGPDEAEVSAAYTREVTAALAAFNARYGG